MAGFQVPTEATPDVLVSGEEKSASATDGLLAAPVDPTRAQTKTELVAKSESLTVSTGPTHSLAPELRFVRPLTRIRLIPMVGPVGFEPTTKGL